MYISFLTFVLDMGSYWRSTRALLSCSLCVDICNCCFVLLGDINDDVDDISPPVSHFLPLSMWLKRKLRAGKRVGLPFRFNPLSVAAYASPYHCNNWSWGNPLGHQLDGEPFSCAVYYFNHSRCRAVCHCQSMSSHSSRHQWADYRRLLRWRLLGSPGDYQLRWRD